MKKINLVVILLFSCIILMSSALAARRHKSYQRDIFDAEQDYLRDSSEDTDTEKKCKSGTALRSRRRNPFNRISGGRDAKEGEFPSFVSLGVGPSLEHISFSCSGVAISKTFILTAAHCFETWPFEIWAAPGIYPPSKWSNHRDKVKIYQVAQICRSPDFNYTFNEGDWMSIHDYQILRVSEPMSDVRPALLNSNPNLHIGFKAISVGIGIIDETHGDREYAERLQALPVELVECLSKNKHFTHICFRSYKPNLLGASSSSLEEAQKLIKLCLLCVIIYDISTTRSDYQPPDTCVGDSGAPIYSSTRNGSHVVVGLTSYGLPGCKKGMSNISVNSNIANVRVGINKLIKSCSISDH